MSQPNASTPPEDDDASFEADDDIQFDQAEYATPAPAGPTCGLCHQPIADAYYEIGGKVFCTTCRGRIEQAFRGGSRLGRVLKAFVFGTAAALAGGALYFAIIRTTGITPYGLIAVVVGFMVGGAVKAGSGNRGGLFYQFLAVFLTYSSIVAMHVPLLVDGMTDTKSSKPTPSAKRSGRASESAPAEGRDADRDKAKDNAKPRPARSRTSAGRLQDANDQAPAQGRSAAEPGRVSPRYGLSDRLLLYSLPVQIAIHAPISGLIFGFALWEAWKITKKVQLSFNGPFRVATSPLNVPSPRISTMADDGLAPPIARTLLIPARRAAARSPQPPELPIVSPAGPCRAAQRAGRDGRSRRTRRRTGPRAGVLARCADLAASREPPARGHRRPDQPARPSGWKPLHRPIALPRFPRRTRPRPIPPILHAGPVERFRESSARWRLPSGSSSSRPSCCWARRSSSCWD